MSSRRSRQGRRSRLQWRRPSRWLNRRSFVQPTLFRFGLDPPRRAPEMLNAAMAEQRTAMALWRTSLAALKDSTAGLGGSLQRYHTNLTSLSQSVTALRTQAKSLQAWAEKTGSSQ